LRVIRIKLIQALSSYVTLAQNGRQRLTCILLKFQAISCLTQRECYTYPEQEPLP
jgi:hypothetical protein